MNDTLDALIVGAGPAGSTAARLLAQWGHAVAIVPGPPARHSMAECLPPSTQKVFRFLGIHDAIEAAGFFRTAGNTVWWGNSGRRVEPYPDGAGYQILRRDFDRLLLGLAESAGTRLLPAGSHPAARFVLDCSGRAGVVARPYRTSAGYSRTVALCGVWRASARWNLPDDTHTLVEAYGDGWAWSVPLSATLRHLAFMVDPVETKLVRGKGLALVYQAELAKTRAFRRVFARATLQSAPWGRDASPYTSRQFCGPGFLLAGDAASCIDPLFSFGVKKAMVSAWSGAVVADTCLRRPAMQQAALRFFDARERHIFEGFRKQASGWSREASSAESQPFWSTRSGSDPELPTNLTRSQDLQSALHRLRSQSSIRLRRAPGVATLPQPVIDGREVVLRDALTAPGLATPLDFIANVELSTLVDLAPHHSQVPDLFEAYNRVAQPVDLSHFLTALSALLAGRILVSEIPVSETI